MDAFLFRLVVLFAPGVVAYVLTSHLRAKKLHLTDGVVFSILYGLLAYLVIWSGVTLIAPDVDTTDFDILTTALSPEAPIPKWLIFSSIPAGVFVGFLSAFVTGNHLIFRVARWLGVPTAEYEAANEEYISPSVKPSQENKVGEIEPESAVCDDDSVTPDQEDRASFSLLIDLTVQGETADAEREYRRLLNEAVDEHDKLEVEATYRALLFRTGDQEALTRLREIDEALGEHSSRVKFLLGFSYEEAEQLGVAQQSYLASAELSEKGDRDRAYKYILAARCAAKLGKRDEAINILLEGKQRLTTSAAKAKILRSVADYYKEKNDTVLQIFSLEAAIREAPSDTELRFEAAYAYSNLGYKEVALFHYTALIGFDSEDVAALNNVALAYEDLGMPIKMVDFFRRASDKGETLSSYHLGTRLLSTGFAAEAEKVLKAATSSEDVDENVVITLNSIPGKKKDENRVEADAMLKARQLQNFFLIGGDSLPAAKEFDLNGEWCSCISRTTRAINAVGIRAVVAEHSGSFPPS